MKELSALLSGKASREATSIQEKGRVLRSAGLYGLLLKHVVFKHRLWWSEFGSRML